MAATSRRGNGPGMPARLSSKSMPAIWKNYYLKVMSKTEYIQASRKRCPWCGEDPLYVAYHDNEWGRLTPDDEQRLFEFLVLESAQAGLSWLIILRKREGYREAFCGFDAREVARMTAGDAERLARFDGIVKNRRKIEAAIHNARLFLEVQKEFGSFHAYICSFLPEGKPIVNWPKTLGDIPASSAVSEAISKDMRRRGFRFFGPVTCYAFLQATGYVDDHLADCHCKNRCSYEELNR